MVMKTISQLNRFSVENNYSKNDSETKTFSTLEEAEVSYKSISENIISETNALEDSHWRNNTEGLSVVLKKLNSLPKNDLNEIINAETEEEQKELFSKAIFDYSEIIKNKFTFLSDEWDEVNDTFIIKEIETTTPIYSTMPFSEECVNLDSNEIVIRIGVIG